MKRGDYSRISDLSLSGEILNRTEALRLFEKESCGLLPLLNAAYEVRHHYFQDDVMIHILNNSQNGFCPEDCHYCAQAKTAKAPIADYPLKSDDEILAEAENAYRKGAFRYCMVFGGRGPSSRRVERLAFLVREIKSRYNLEVCVSAGLLDEAKAKVLKEAGLDRLNHNLNTSEKQYGSICTTHTFEDRLATLSSAKKAGLQVCSGLIIGMNESHDDILDVAYQLRELKAESIPVNFFIPVPGHQIQNRVQLDPDFCLRVLCVIRLINPSAEIRVAAGREIHLRDMEVMSFYPANSLFLDGYLNARGNSRQKTLTMIRDAGFNIQSDIPLDELIQEGARDKDSSAGKPESPAMKDLNDLRPFRARSNSSPRGEEVQTKNS